MAQGSTIGGGDIGAEVGLDTVVGASGGGGGGLWQAGKHSYKRYCSSGVPPAKGTVSHNQDKHLMALVTTYASDWR